MVPGVRESVVSALLDFLYTGEMTVVRSDTADLQLLIETLQIDPALISVDTLKEKPEEHQQEAKDAEDEAEAKEEDEGAEAASEEKDRGDSEEEVSPPPLRRKRKKEEDGGEANDNGGEEPAGGGETLAKKPKED